MATPGRRILVAGMGNLLRGDDGFGVEVIRRLRERGDLPAGVRAVDVGIGGIPLVQELLDGYDLLIIVDAVSRGKPPGTLMTLAPQLPDLYGLTPDDVGTMIGDPHTTTPSRVLLLARALGVLPQETVIVGCEPEGCDELRLTLSAPVAGAVDPAAERVTALTRAWLASHDASSPRQTFRPAADTP
jgi:hydrogenase maturation protease